MDVWNPADLGKVEYYADLDADVSTPDGQTSLKEFCEKLRGANFVSNSDVNCWFDDFEKYIDGRYTIPIADAATFKTELKAFGESPLGAKLEQSGDLVLVDDKLKYFQVTTATQGKAWLALSAENDLD